MEARAVERVRKKKEGFMRDEEEEVESKFRKWQKQTKKPNTVADRQRH